MATRSAIDYVLVNGNVLPRFAAIQWGRMNANFPESYRADATRSERLSDHDPLAVSSEVLWRPNHTLVPMTIAVTVTDRVDPAPVSSIPSDPRP